METKVIEIRDRATCILVLVTKLTSSDPIERYRLFSSGYCVEESMDGRIMVMITKLEDVESHYAPYDWLDGRTMMEAHKYIQGHFDELKTGDVVDIEYVLGETTECKKSQYYDLLGGE